MKKSIFYILLLGLTGGLAINFGLYRMYENGLWHPFNSKAIVHGPGGKGHSLQRYQDWQTLNNVEWVIMGSSHAYRAWNTELLQREGMLSFNWGSSSQSPLNTYYLLKTLKPWEKGCQGLILDVFPPLLTESQGVESTIDLNTNLPLNRYLFLMSARSSGILALNHWFATLIDRLFRPNSSLIQTPQEGDDYLSGGYVRTSLPADHTVEMPAEWQTDWTVSEVQLSYLKACISLLKEKGIRVVLVCQPQKKELVRHPSYQKAIDIIDDVAEELKVPFFDCSELSQRINLNFFDWHHLDSTSVNKYNHFLLRDSSFLAALHN